MPNDNWEVSQCLQEFITPSHHLEHFFLNGFHVAKNHGFYARHKTNDVVYGYIPDTLDGWEEEIDRTAFGNGLLYFQKELIYNVNQVYFILEDMAYPCPPNSILSWLTIS